MPERSTLPKTFGAACTRYARHSAFCSFSHSDEYHGRRAICAPHLRVAGQRTQTLAARSPRTHLAKRITYVVVFYGVLDAGRVVLNVNPLATPRKIQVQIQLHRSLA